MDPTAEVQLLELWFLRDALLLLVITANLFNDTVASASHSTESIT
jgi:hypothetical protein